MADPFFRLAVAFVGAISLSACDAPSTTSAPTAAMKPEQTRDVAAATCFCLELAVERKAQREAGGVDYEYNPVMWPDEEKVEACIAKAASVDRDEAERLWIKLGPLEDGLSPLGGTVNSKKAPEACANFSESLVHQGS
jgi:hypothetical protein